MLTAILRAHGLSVFSNQTGANLPQGIASAMLATIPLDGRLTEHVAVLEVDEAYGPQLANELAPHSVLLINVQVDQLNRFYDPARVVGMLEEFARVADRHLVFNGDDHNLVEMALQLSGNGATQSAFVVAPALLNDGPAWLARGDNPALAVSAEQPNAAVVVEALGDRSATLSIDGKLATVALPGRGLHYAADAAGAVAMALALLGDDLDLASVTKGLAGMEAVYGRGEILQVTTSAGEAESIELLTMKNPPSLQVNLDYLDLHLEQVFFAVDEGTPDPSWIYGTDLSRLEHVDVLTGSKAWQLATRLRYSDIAVSRVEPDLKPALEAFLALPRPTRGIKTMIVNYEQMMLVRKHLGFLELEATP